MPARKAKRSLGVPSLRDRAAGILLHVTSLPGPHGSGDLGREARETADFLARAGLRWWQMLPVNPPGYGSSPYQAQSAMAGNPLLIDPDALVERWLLDDAPPAPSGDPTRVDFAAASAHRETLLRRAFQNFASSRDQKARARLAAFRKQNRAWLDDWALFAAIKAAHGGVAWTDWPAPLRSRDAKALKQFASAHGPDVDYHAFVQWVFAEQWDAFRAHCADKGIALLGDIPIFVAHDSADVWAHPDLFRLDRNGQPTVVAGVPPDYFSATGQRWGNPLYRWDVMRRKKYRWWTDRLAITLRRFDAIRLDHFIGFQRYWEIPASEPTAVKGKWVAGPREHFFKTVRKALGELPLVAEDLGAVTPEVLALRDEFGFPGLKILQFAFGDDPSAPSFIPHAYPRNCVAYTGTHDNDTTVGWFGERGGGHSTRSIEQADRERARTLAYLGTDGSQIHWDMIRAIMMSVANMAIAPAQDFLGLGSEARMNRPGLGAGNWEWRLPPGALDESLATGIRGMTDVYGRSGA